MQFRILYNGNFDFSKLQSILILIELLFLCRTYFLNIDENISKKGFRRITRGYVKTNCEDVIMME
jgi:hypothetical protein